MKRRSILVLTLVLLAAGTRAETWSDTIFVGDVSTSGWAAVSGAAVAITNGGYYTNVAVVQTNYYRLSATNVAGRLPGTTNIVVSWLPHATLSNACALSWTRHGGILRHVVEKSYNAGSTWTNWLTLGPGVSTWTDTGSNTWTASVFTNVVPTLIPAGTLPWSAADTNLQAQIDSATNLIQVETIARINTDANLSNGVAWLANTNVFMGGTNTFMGNVGIGTNSPVSALDVVGNLYLRNTPTIQYYRADGSNTLRFYPHGSASDGYPNAAYWMMYVGGTNFVFNVRGNGSENQKFIVTDTSRYVVGAEPFVVDLANGRVGIGTNAPAKKLHIEGGGLRQSAEGIVFTETADDNMGLESVTYAIGNSQTSGVWLGYATLYAAPGLQNAAVGGFGLYQATGSYNSAVGYQAGYQSTGSYNAAVGNASLYQSSGTRNSAMGMNALVLAPGSYNAAMGNSALRLSPGDYNSALGYQAGNQAGGVSNVYLGAKAGNAAGAMTNAIAIGAGAVPLGDNSAVLGNSATVTTEIKGTRLITGGTTFLYYASSTNYVAMWADQSAYYIQAVSNGAAGVGVVRTNALFP